MPSGNVRPRASQVPPLGAGAIAEYQEAGWDTDAATGRVGTRTAYGACSACQAPCLRYGPSGQPLCPECRTGRLAPPGTPPDPTDTP